MRADHRGEISASIKNFDLAGRGGGVPLSLFFFLPHLWYAEVPQARDRTRAIAVTMPDP